MTTRADLRLALRQRLEDTSASPLWDDATLDRLLAEALRHYGSRFPAERSLIVIVAEGATAVPVDPSLESTHVVRVIDPSGVEIERLPWPQSTRASGPGRQAWRWWSGGLVLARPAAGGNWTIDYLDRRTLPGDDVTPIELAAGDEEIVALLAAAGALLRRAVEDGKRGADPRGLAFARVAERHERAAERLMSARRKRAWGGWLGE
jgi:hypothetical protein